MSGLDKRANNASAYIVTLTSIPPRLAKMETVLQSFLNQSIRPAMIVVNIPYTYHRFPTNDVKVPAYLLRGKTVAPGVTRLARYREVYVNRCRVDYGPATKLLGLLELGIRFAEGTMILVTDDDNVKMPHWAKTLADNIRLHPQAVSSIHSHLVYGGRGFGFYTGVLDLNDVRTTYERVKHKCHLVDDDMLTNHCRYRSIPLSFLPDAYPLFPETPEFTHKLRDLGGENAREKLQCECNAAFKLLASSQ